MLSKQNCLSNLISEIIRVVYFSLDLHCSEALAFSNDIIINYSRYTRLIRHFIFVNVPPPRKTYLDPLVLLPAPGGEDHFLSRSNISRMYLINLETLSA